MQLRDAGEEEWKPLMRPCVIRELSRPNEALTYLSYQPPSAPSCLLHTRTPTNTDEYSGRGHDKHRCRATTSRFFFFFLVVMRTPATRKKKKNKRTTTTTRRSARRRTRTTTTTSTTEDSSSRLDLGWLPVAAYRVPSPSLTLLSSTFTYTRI